jgi:hypothetical protein
MCSGHRSAPEVGWRDNQRREARDSEIRRLLRGPRGCSNEIAENELT